MLIDRELILKGRDFVIKKQLSLGLPQGCKLSPVLFNLYTAGVHSVIGNNDKLFQFADDFAVLGRGDTVQEANQVAQRAVTRIVTKLRSLNLQVNARKCGCIGFKVKDKVLKIKIGNERIEQVNVIRYLGVWIDKRLNFRKHMEILTDDCKKRLNVIKRVSWPKWGAHPSVTDMLRKALITSKILYGINVYGSGVKGGFDKLMKVENACARVVLGAINSTPIHTLYSELGEMPLLFKKEWVVMKETVER